MSDYDSGDDLLADFNADALVTSTKRPLSRDQGENGRAQDDINKRAKVETALDDDRHDALALQLLKEKFGYDDFRHEQRAAIRAILRGDNALVIFPTGAVKSLCYQIPAIAFEKLDTESGEMRPHGSGITVVVSPLIALMKDQVDALKRRGIPADCLDSTKTFEQTKEISAAMREGRLRLLYCAPERLNNEGFVASMAHVPGGVRLLAVDEAHCISEWGHSFRPDYLKVARFAQEVQAESVICLTATATQRVAEDVQHTFDITDSNVYRTSPYRPNLQLLAESVKTKTDKYPKLIKFLKEHPGSTLIYVTQQRETEELARDLRQKGFQATAFHAGIEAEVKMKIQDNFMASKIPIVVATIAFGMGIDKADIRNIVHFDLASTVEEYSQQIGRAGRDGLQSHCMFYLCPEDFYIKENFARADLPTRESLRGLLKDIFTHPLVDIPQGQAIKLSHNRLSQDYDVKANPLNIIMAILELRFGLVRAITPEYSSYKFEACGTYEGFRRSEKSPEGRAIFENARKAIKLYEIDVSGVARSTGIPRNDIVRRLNQLNDLGALVLKASGVQNRYRILESLPQTDSEITAIADDMYAEMESRESDALSRIHEVEALITGEQCFALALAKHFGMGDDGLPDGSTTSTAKTGKMSCGHCTYCLTGKPVQLPEKPEKPVDITGIKEILDACEVRDDPRLLARVAFGIRSPRVSKLKYDKLPVFASLEDHDFESLLKEFTRACEAAAREPGPQPKWQPEPKPKNDTSSSARGRGSYSHAQGGSLYQRGTYQRGAYQRGSYGRGGSYQRGSNSRGTYGQRGGFSSRSGSYRSSR